MIQNNQTHSLLSVCLKIAQNITNQTHTYPPIQGVVVLFYFDG